MTSSIRSSSQTLTVNPTQRAQLRAGVVGIGKQAIEDHIPGLLASDGAKLVAICDDDPEVVREQQYRQRVPGYADFREMFKAEHLDLVVVATPHHVGRDVIYAAAEHGMPIYEYAPKEVKHASVGRGAAQKDQVAFMIRAQLRLAETPPSDAADALAVGITHFQNADAAAVMGLEGRRV